MGIAPGILIAGTTAVILFRGVVSRIDVYAAFLRGAERGMRSSMSVLPVFCAMMLMLSVFTTSGMAEVLTGVLSPMSRLIGLPQEVTPLALLRPLTGSGSLAALNAVFSACGPDSRAGMVASVLMGSGETLFYTMSVYLGAAGIRKLPHVAWVSLTAYLLGVVVCCLIVHGG